MRVAVVGYSGNVSDDKIRRLKKLCEILGKRMAKENFLILTGGRDGIMELVSKAVKEAGGTTVGVLPLTPSGSQANPYVDVPIYTGLDFQMRSFIMLHSAEAVVAIGGEIGTAIEILGAYAQRKRLILLRGTGGWTDRFASVLIDGKYLDSRKLVEVQIVDVDPEGDDEEIERSVEEVIRRIKGI